MSRRWWKLLPIRLSVLLWLLPAAGGALYAQLPALDSLDTDNTKDTAVGVFTWPNMQPQPVSLVKDTIIDGQPLVLRRPFLQTNTQRLPATRQGLQPQPRSSDSGIEAPITYSAKDSLTFDIDRKKMVLYEEAEVNYQDFQIQSARVLVDYDKTEISAMGLRDTNYKLTKTPVFKENEDTYLAETMRYNYSSQKGRIQYAYTKQDLDIIQGDVIRRNPDNTYYISNGRFSSCDCEGDPDYYFKSKRIKIIPNDKIISGPAVLYIMDVPTPLVIPFGFFPQREQRASGIIIPTFGEVPAQGFFLQNGGYYWKGTQYFDAKLTGDIFTNGSFTGRLNSQYRANLSNLSGNVGFDYTQRRSGYVNTDPNFTSTSTWNLRWAHNQQLNPQSSFNANVNMGSSQHLRNNALTANNTNDYLNNQLQSSLSYQVNFANSPWSMTVNADHSQDLVRETVSLGLPNIAINRGQFFPFRRKKGIGEKKWYENISATYNADIQNNIRDMADSLLFTPEMVERLRPGIQHRAGMNTNFKLLKFIQLTPNINYTEIWHARDYIRQIQQTTQLQQQIDTLPGGQLDTTFVEVPVDTIVEQRPWDFVSGRHFSMGARLTTNIYGMFQPRSKRQFAMRHQIQPSLSYNYAPDFGTDFWGYYREIQTGEDGTVDRYSRFQSGPYNVPGPGEKQTINFGINNIIQAKYLKNEELKKTLSANADDKPKFSYISILDGLSINSSYNFAADSMKLAPVRVNAFTNILNGKFNLQGNLVLDPYDYVVINPESENPSFRRVDRFLIQERGRLFDMPQANFAVGTQFQSKNETPTRDSLSAKKRAWYDQYTPFNWRWQFGLNYNLTYRRITPEVPAELVHSFRFNGRLAISQNWNMDVSGNYDFEAKEIADLRINLTREFKCWRLTFNWTPIGFNPFYSLTIGVKSPTLQDLKVEKNSPPGRGAAF